MVKKLQNVLKVANTDSSPILEKVNEFGRFTALFIGGKVFVYDTVLEENFY